MSSNEETPDIDPNTPATFGMMEEQGATVIAVIRQDIKKLWQAVDQRLAPLEADNRALKDMLEAARQQQPQQVYEQPQQVQQQQPRRSIGDMATEIQPILDLLRQTGVIKGPQQEPTQLENMATLATKIAEREAVNALKTQIRHGLRRRLIFPEEVEATLGTALDNVGSGSGATHAPQY